MASRLSALLLLGIICLGFATGNAISDCCLSAVDKRVPPSLVQSYSLQRAGHGCGISATVIITKARKELCLLHPDDSSKVRKLLEALDKRQQ
ncbi:unnamed protein product [Ophioblennius macclurei]